MEVQEQNISPIAVGLARASLLSGLSKRSLRYLIDANRLPVCRIGRRLLIRVDSLDRFLSLGSHPGPTEPQKGKMEGEN